MPNETNTPEPLAAILAEMRGLAESQGRKPRTNIPTISVRAWNGIINRIEAAAERERIELREDEARMLLREYAAAPDESLTPSALELKHELLRLAPAPGNAAAMRDTHGVTGDGWYGFDLDGTLARYDGWKGIDHIGEPISAMVALIKRLHAEGKIVKVMTARVAPRNDTIDGHDARYYVCKWCAKHLGFTPDVVFQKDARMIELYDDRVKQVVSNTGILVENLAGCGNAAAMREALRDSSALLAVVHGDEYADEITRQLDANTAALAAPARNCDRFATADEARRAFESAHSHGIVRNLYTAAFDWLFAPAEGGDHA